MKETSSASKSGLDSSGVRLEKDGCFARFKIWVANNQCIAGALLAVSCLLIIAAVVLIPIGLTGGFKPKDNSYDEDSPLKNMPRNLILQYANIDINVLDRIPKSLLPFLSNIKLPSSGLQILSADTERILREVFKHLRNDKELVLLVRDAFLSIPTKIDNPSSAAFVAAMNNLPIGTEQTGRKLTQAPTDPMFSYQWHLQESELYSVKPQRAWATTSGSRNVIVAVVDTGVDYNHADLAGNMWVNSREIPGDRIDNDGNGFVDDYLGWNFGSGNNNPMDTNGHGSNVAGIIAAVSNNGVGVGSIAYNTRIMALRVTDSAGSLSLTSAMSAFDYALRMGAAIVSCSWGPGWYRYRNPGFVPTTSAAKWERDLTAAYTTAIRPLETAGVMVVAAAGNENMNLDNLARLNYFYGPCLIALSNVICVMAGDRSSANKAFFSNFGSSTVDIAAPGVTMCSTTCTGCYYGGNYACYDGTSQATPAVSATLALTLAALGNPNFTSTWRQARDIVLLNGTAASTLPVINRQRINAGNAVTIAASSGLFATPINVSSAVTIPGIYEEYYNNPTGQLSSVANLGSPLDNSLRGAAFPITSYKQVGSSWLYRAFGLIRLTSAGSWGLRVVTDRNFSMFISGQRVPFGAASTTYAASINAGAPGWFRFELLVQWPSTRIELTWRPPSSATFVVLDVSNFQVNSTGVLTPAPANALRTALQSPGFFITYATMSAFVGRGLVSTMVPSSLNLPFRATTPDLDFASPGSWGALLYPDGLPNSMYGYINTTLNVAAGSSYTFELSCSICQLTINGQAILDIWENTLKLSTCITFRTGGVYDLIIKFGENALINSDHTLRWATCTTTQQTGTFSSVAPSTDHPLLFRPGVDTAGYTDGMSCDVYRSPDLLTTRPDHKARVLCGIHMTTSCITPFEISVTSLVPNARARWPVTSGQLFSFRCTALWANNYTILTGNTSDIGSVAISVMGLPLSDRNTFISRGMFHQLVVEVRNVTSDTVARVFTNSGTLQLDPAFVLSPIVPFAGNISWVGAMGHFSDSWPWSSLDIGNAVPYAVSSGRSSYNSSVQSSSRGLDDWLASYPLATNTWTYAWCRGFLRITQAGNYTISIDESIGQGTLLVIDGIPVKNSPQWNMRRSTAQSFQVSAWLNAGLFYMEMVSKAEQATPTAGSNHLWSVRLNGTPVAAGTLIQSLEPVVSG